MTVHRVAVVDGPRPVATLAITAQTVLVRVMSDGGTVRPRAVA